MTEAAHFVVGAAICRHVRCKPLGLALAFASHFALDAIPHFEHPRVLGLASWTPVVLVSWLATVIVGAALWQGFRGERESDPWTRVYLVLGGVLGGLPDQLKWWLGRPSLAWEANKEAHWWGPGYREITHESGVALPLAIGMAALELAVIALGLWLLFRAPRRVPQPPDALA